MERKMERKNKDFELKDDFLAAYHSILFSRRTENDVDVERVRLAVKFMTAKKFVSEDAAGILLNVGLKRYQRLLEHTGLLKEFKSPDNQDRIKWRSSLEKPQQALSLTKPFPCQKDSSDRVCGRRDLVDRDVANFIKIPDIDVNASTSRKISAGQPAIARERTTKHHLFARHRHDHLDNPQNRKTHRNESTEIIEKENSKKIVWVRPRSGVFTHDNDHSSKIHNKNHFEIMEDDENIIKYDQAPKCQSFRTANAQLHVDQQQQKNGKKSLGGKGSVKSKFVCPLKRDKEREEGECESMAKDINEPEDERLKGIDEKFIELVRNEIMDSGTLVSWDDVAGLEHAKKIIKEIVVFPMLRPDIFTGLRRPPKGILLFGPPGTGKTLIGKCIASQSKSTFFSISASSLTSKWIGEGEKMVRTLFAVAQVHQPSVIFIDEIDSLLTQRSETEHESSRRLKTEFLVQLDGAATGEEDRILVIGATNRPQELDEAARRRFVKRLYIPLPEFEARRQIIINLLAAERHELNHRDIDNIAKLSEHYSGADMTNLCKEASMEPIRSIPFHQLENIRKEDVRCVTAKDFNEALSHVRPSVSQADLGLYLNWDRTYGSGTASICKSSV